MLPSAYSYVLTRVSLYAPRELAWGSVNGTTAILPLCFGKAGKSLFFPSLFPEDLVTITTAPTDPDGGQAGALVT